MSDYRWDKANAQGWTVEVWVLHDLDTSDKPRSLVLQHADSGDWLSLSMNSDGTWQVDEAASRDAAMWMCCEHRDVYADVPDGRWM